jgi:hypothetical protein
MSTAPATPVATPEHWYKKYERTIVIALVLLAGAWGYGKYTDVLASRAETRATVSEQALASQKDTDAQFALQTAQVLAQYQIMCQSLVAQNNALQASVAQRQAILVKQVTQDSTLSLPDLAKRLKTLGNAPETSVSLLGDHIDLTQAGAVAITQTLEALPVIQEDLKDTQATLGATQGALTQANVVLVDQNKQITGLNLAAVDQDRACKAQVAALKADARKSKLRWFKLGFLLGFGSGAYLGHVL